jgi:hypothetical protein
MCCEGCTFMTMLVDSKRRVKSGGYGFPISAADAIKRRVMTLGGKKELRGSCGRHRWSFILVTSVCIRLEKHPTTVLLSACTLPQVSKCVSLSTCVDATRACLYGATTTAPITWFSLWSAAEKMVSPDRWQYYHVLFSTLVESISAATVQFET